MPQRTHASLVFLCLLTTSVGAHEPSQLFRSAAEAYRGKNWRQASDGFAQLIQEFPESQDAYLGCYYAAECHFALKEYALARRNYQDFLTRTPPSAHRFAGHREHAQYFLARCYQLQGQLPQARVALETFTHEYPESPLNSFVLLDLGNIYLALNAKTRAADAYQRSLREFPHPQTRAQCERGLAIAHTTTTAATAAELGRAYSAVCFTSDEEASSQPWRRIAQLYRAHGNATSSIDALCQDLTMANHFSQTSTRMSEIRIPASHSPPK